MKIVFSENRFIFKLPFEKRALARESGFYWSTTEKIWYTRNPSVAALLPEYCDEAAKKQIRKLSVVVEEWTGSLSIPKGETLYPFQDTAARFSLSRNKSYLGLDPGLGKTPIAAVVAATLKAGVVYICPPFLVTNTEIEFNRWAPGLPRLVIPDSMITKEHIRFLIEDFVAKRLALKQTPLLVIDEAHRFKNDTAQRTKAVFGTKTDKGIADLFDKILYLSGTPMPNRPIELFPVLHHSAPNTIDHMGKFEYGRKYCAAHQNQFGWDFTGASNIPLLHSKVVGPFMLRYRKSEVLKDLPPKTEEIVFIGDDLPPKLAALDKDILKHVSPTDLVKKQISLKLGDGDVHLMTYRKELGLLKVKPCLEYYRYLLEETEDAMLIFAHHKEVIKNLAEGLADYGPLVITGETPMAERHEIVKTFQSDPRRRIFLGNIQAAGVGLTLTKATRVNFCEFSWVPAENEQAADRAHRIGQLGNVHVQYMAFKNSVDRAVLETCIYKKKTIDKFDQKENVK